MTFEEATSQYLNSRKLRPQTRRTYETYYRKYLGPLFGQEVINDIHSDDVKAFFDRLSKELKAKHANDVLRFARAVCKQQVQNAVTNPFTVDLTCDTERDQKPYSQSLSREEISSTLQALSTHWRPFFTMLAYTGMRMSEVAALKWGDVDWKNSVICVRAVRVKGFESLAPNQREVSIRKDYGRSSKTLRSQLGTMRKRITSS